MAVSARVAAAKKEGVNRRTKRVRDSPGSNMSSEQGNAGSPESGQGETADRGGDKQLAPDATGQAGQDPGPAVGRRTRRRARN